MRPFPRHCIIQYTENSVSPEFSYLKGRRKLSNMSKDPTTIAENTYLFDIKILTAKNLKTDFTKDFFAFLKMF